MKEYSKYLNTKDLPDPTSLKNQEPNSVFLIWKKTNLPELVFGMGITLEVQSSRNWRAYHFVSTFLLKWVINTEAAAIKCLPTTHQPLFSIYSGGNGKAESQWREEKWLPILLQRNQRTLDLSVHLAHYFRGWEGGMGWWKLRVVNFINQAL